MRVWVGLASVEAMYLFLTLANRSWSERGAPIRSIRLCSERTGRRI